MTASVVNLFTQQDHHTAIRDGAERERRRKRIRSLAQAQVELIIADRQTIASANLRIQQGMHALAILGQEEQLLDAPA